MYAVIRAGGVGTRLWPVSRQNSPKQLHRFTSNKTLLAETIARVRRVVPLAHMYVSTNERFAETVTAKLPVSMRRNMITEPAQKDTAAAIGLELITILKKDPEAVVASLGSDHLVRNPKEFGRILSAAFHLAKKHPQYLVMIGVQPTYPDTGYGYLKMGKIIDVRDHVQLLEVKRFCEKPVLERAKKYIAEGYLWNGNMFVWKAKTMLSLYKKYLPSMYRGLVRIQDALGTKNEAAVLRREYRAFSKIAVDYAILEKTNKIAAVKLEAGWSDIGDWATLKNELATNEQDNYVRAQHVGIDTENTIVRGDKKKLIATLGVKDLIIVDTPDALLVCDKYEAQRVKELVRELERKKKQKYL